jgi:two-component system sensor kinase FixL
MTEPSQQDLAARNRAILNTAIDAIITIDQHGLIETVNQATTQMLGYAEEELVGQNVSMLMPEPYKSAHDSYLENYVETGLKKIIGIGREVVGRRKDGTTFPIHLAVSEFDSAGRRMFTGIIRDISDLKHTQQRLVQSARLAAIGQMVTGLAHESRNALQRAQAFLDMLALDLADQPEQVDLTRRTQGALKDLYRLYEEVRNYAAPIQLECRPCDIVSVCEKVWDYLDEAHKPKFIQLNTPTSGEFKPSVDVHRIEQVIRNIFENAIEACPEHALVTVNCEETVIRDQSAIRLSFEDTGPGLTTEVRKRLFEPFFTTRQRGTGLGMAICERMVQAHRGTISADSNVEVGTRIVVVLPTKHDTFVDSGS